MNITSGTLLNNRYRITSVLGQGGMGAVYRARDEILDISVAVKENLFLTEEYSRQFQREANILASLRHPSLPRVRDYFTLPGVGQYLVMDYIEGEDLRQRIERLGILPEEEVALIGAHICEALTHLHRRVPPVIHRDIKPGNIKVTPEGDVVLVDFGLAKEMATDNQVTTTGARAMTPGYSPPEQYGTARTDARSDIYSLGATLYAALTGVIPEDGLTRATGRTRLTPIRQLHAKVNRKLASVVEKALEVEPEDRFQSAEEFKQELLEACNLIHLFQEPKTVTPPPEGGDWAAEELKPASRMPTAEEVRPRTYTRSRRRRKRLIANIAVTGVLSIAVLLGAIFALRSSTALASITPSAPPPALAGQVATQTPEPALSTVIPPTQGLLVVQTTQEIVLPSPTPTQAPVPTATPLGGGASEIAFTSNRSLSFQIWMMNGDGTNQNQITNIRGGACQATWSPDGKKLAFISPCSGRKDIYENTSIYTIEVLPNGFSDPEPLPVPPNPAGDFDPAWSPDGQRIAFASLRNGRSHIFVYDFATSLTSELSNTVFPDKHPAWSPTGKQIAFIRQMPNGQVWLMGDDGSFPDRFSPAGGINNLWPTWSRDGESIFYSQTSVDEIIPWLIRLRYEDRNTAREVRLPSNSSMSVGPVAKVDVSPDGQWLAYESWPLGSNHDIYLMNTTGLRQIRLTSDQSFDFAPVWRPAQP